MIIKEWLLRRRIFKRLRTAEDKMKRRYKFYRGGFFALAALMLFTVYANYDYWVFKTLIANNYVFTDALDELYSRHIREENRRGFRADFDRVVISVVTAELSAINNDRHTHLYAPQHITHVRQTTRTAARRVSFEAVSDDTVKLFIPNIERYTREFIVNNKHYLAEYPNLIIDLRGNPGGWIVEFQRIADLFVPAGAVVSHQETRLQLFTREITSDNEPFFDFDNIIILQNRRTASAAESLIMALSEHVPYVTTIGQTTFGKATGQVTIPLTGGYAVRATVLNVRGPQNQCIHGVGIEPDIAFDAEYDLLEEALRILGRNNI